MTTGLAGAFLRALSPENRALLGPRSGELEPLLEGALHDGLAAWQGVSVHPEGFVGFLAARVDLSRKQAPLEFPYAADLFLAYGCSIAEPAALAHMERAHFSRLRRHLARLTLTEDLLDEVAQSLRAKLFVRPTRGRGGFDDYSGHGPLEAWFRVNAMHVALDLLRTDMRARTWETRSVVEQRNDLAAIAAGAPGSGKNPEQALVRARSRAQIQGVLRLVLADAPAKERALLRLHFLNGASLEDLAKTFKVHRATVARWISAARQGILKETQRRMIEQLGLSPSEAKENLQMSRSDWSLSVEFALGEDGDKHRS